MFSLTTVVTAFGWVGAAAGLVAYAMVSQGRWRPDSIAFQVTNLAAALILLAVAAIHGVWPSAASNAAAIAIGVNALYMVVRARLRQVRETTPEGAGTTSA